jgi:UDP-glucose 4-epimerase
MIIGGAGFVGSHIVDRLLAEGFAVDVVDDLTTGSLANLASARSQHASLTIHHLDATGAEFPQLVTLRRPSVIINVAAFTAGNDVTALQRSFHLVTATIDAARRYQIPKVIITVPAVSLYGPANAKEIPLKEARGFQPDDEVGVTAVAVVRLLEVARARHAVEFTALALADVYGPRQRRDQDPVAGACAGKPLERTLDLVYVEDIAEAVFKALGRGGGLVVNLGSGEAVTSAELARAAGHEPAAVVLRAQRFAISPVRARIHLSWAPWTSLADGLVSETDPQKPDGSVR